MNVPAIASAISFTVLGQLPSLKNSRPIYRNRKTGKPFSARSDAIKRYYENFALQVPPQYRNSLLFGTRAPLRAIISVFYQSGRSDLDCSAVYDVLQLCGVIVNDRQIQEKHEYAHIDAKNPRVEITVELL